MMDADETAIDTVGEAVELDSNGVVPAGTTAGVEPHPIWRDLYEQGLIHQPYRPEAGREIIKILAESDLADCDITTDDILRALGRR